MTDRQVHNIDLDSEKNTIRNGHVYPNDPRLELGQKMLWSSSKGWNQLDRMSTLWFDVGNYNGWYATRCFKIH